MSDEEKPVPLAEEESDEAAYSVTLPSFHGPLDLLLHLAIPGRAAMSYATMFGGLVIVAARTAIHPNWIRDDAQAWVWWLFPAAALLQSALVLIVAPSLHRRRVTLRYTRDFSSYLWYGVRWLPTLARSLLRRTGQEEWARTEHGRAVAIGDLTDR